jgi:hypothetical protein
MSAAVVLGFLMLGPAWAKAQEVDALLARGMQLHQAGDLLGAVQNYQIALEAQPDRTDIRSVADMPAYIDAHVLLATTYYRLKRKEDGDRERRIVEKLTAEAQAKQPKPESPGAGTGGSVPPSPDSRKN